jgi:hypothetical protein
MAPQQKLNCSTLRMQFSKSESPRPLPATSGKNRVTGCGADRDRTDDIQLAKLALSQLSYSPEKDPTVPPWRPRPPGSGAMGLGGLEPPTSRLSGARSSQLSYRPVVWPVGGVVPHWLGPVRTRFKTPLFQRASRRPSSKIKKRGRLGLSKPNSKSGVD